ncbi:MAG TPA: DLW-39 family protein [Nocardioidaceae bacterium]|nr:DLW-39 family protein [Nocardioidaceae bacterium]
MKKLLVVAAAAVGAYVAFNKSKSQHATQDLWAEATDSVDKSESR